MADDNGQRNESTKTSTYVLAADGMRLKGRRYRRGDKVELPAEQGDRLVESGSLVENENDLEGRDTSAAATAQAGLRPVADEASTLDAAQSVDEDGEPKESSFGHPDQVEKAEKEQREVAEKSDATKPAARRTTTRSGPTLPTDGGQKPGARQQG